MYVIIAILVLITAGRQIIRTVLSPLRHIPGPFLARFTRLYEVYALWRYEYTDWNIKLHDIYGPIVRLAPNRYSINDAAAAKAILGNQSLLDKSRFYHSFGSPWESNLFQEQSITVHTRMKRPMAPLYSSSSLQSYEPFVDTCNKILIDRLQRSIVEGEELNLRELLQFCAFDVIGEITVGSRFGFMEKNEDGSKIIEAINGSMTHSATFGLIPEMHTVMVYIAEFLRIKLPFLKMFAFVNLHLHNRVKGVSKSHDNRADFIDKLLPLERQGKATRLNTFNALAQNIAAGSDTTAISLASALSYLATNPTVLSKLRDELDSAYLQGTLSTFAEAKQLPYMQAVILESLRMHPAVGMPLMRIVQPSGMTFCNQFFPGGTEVGINAWVIHSNTAIWGSDARTFRPERWLTDDKEERATLDRNFFSFGAGPRVCLGRNISMLELTKVLPVIVRDFDIDIDASIASGIGEKKRKTFWFTKQDLRCCVKMRAGA